MSLDVPPPIPPEPVHGFTQKTPPAGDDSALNLTVVPLAEEVEEAKEAEEEIAVALPAPQPTHPGFWWSVLWCILFLSVTQTPGSILAVIEFAVRSSLSPTPIIPKNVKSPGEAARHLYQSEAMQKSLMHAFAVTEICVVLFAWGAVRLVNGRDWPRKVALRRPSASHLVLALLGLPALSLLGGGFYVVARQFLPGMESLLKFLPGWGGGDVHMLEEVMRGIGQWPVPFAVLVIGLGPGIGEELWCRAFLGRGLVGRYGIIVGIVLTSFFFGLIHLDPAQGAMAMMMGVGLHFVYQMTRSLWIPVLLHFLNNSLSVVAQRFPELDALDEHPMQFLPMFAGAAVLAAAVAYAFYQSRARLAPELAGARYYWQPDHPGVEYPPPGSGTVVAHRVPSKLALSLAAAGFILFLSSCWLI